MSNTCDNCKWWGIGYKENCSYIDTIQATKDKNTKIEVIGYALDDTGLDVRLVTGPKFGCIKFEKR